MRNLKGSNEQGFTFLEAMVVVLIIGILLTLAVPTYQAYIIKGNRTDMQTVMVQIAQKMATYQAANRSYQGAVLSNAQIYGTTTYPKEEPLYNLQLTLSDSNTI